MLSITRVRCRDILFIPIQCLSVRFYIYVNSSYVNSSYGSAEVSWIITKKAINAFKNLCFPCCLVYLNLRICCDRCHSISTTNTNQLTLITVPPVLIYTVSVHKACRAIDPSARSVGLVPVILFTIFLTPLESGLILPFKNLWVSRCILNRYKTLSSKAALSGP